jgi:hypothetical protein
MGAELGALIGAGLLRKKAGELRFERFAQDVGVPQILRRRNPHARALH